ncbi:hypothetical protein Syun_027215 [Stephania yunnanensis]|uniref:Uncharacterized protein n=1 Tax=Stephania yunnanensis TaxID=152371 RepID=A0AAP0EP20_9MAGN
MAPRLFFTCFGRGGGAASSSRPAAAAHHQTTPETVTSDQSAPVVVELFSSQGCATSPEAELLVSRLGRGDFAAEAEGAAVVVLAFHVDYWDYMGWKDPYGASQWTVRQKAYVEALRLDTLFTPQVVVQGTAQCVGTDQDGMLGNIRAATRFPAPSLQATFQRLKSETLQVNITGSLRSKIDHQGVNVMVALYESGIVTDCQKGVNKGRVLSNDYVVRRLEKLCTLKDASVKKTINGNISFSLWESFNSTKCGVVVFAQNSSLQIFGSQKFVLPENL